MRILLLGATGMLGRRLIRQLESDASIQVFGTTTGKITHENLFRFHWPEDSLEHLLHETNPSVILNLAAKLDSKSLDYSEIDRQKAFMINSELPSALSVFSDQLKVIHMSTDGVFSGNNPPYSESSVTDGEGVYAKSKIQGEASLQSGKILRCSVIGRSPNPQVSIPNLLSRQPKNSMLHISENEQWNGVTSDALAEFIHSILSNNFFDMMRKIQHVTPVCPISKIELFRKISKSIGRVDLKFSPVFTKLPKSRILITEDLNFITEVWGKTSFRQIPTIEEMIEKSDFKNV